MPVLQKKIIGFLFAASLMLSSCQTIELIEPDQADQNEALQPAPIKTSAGESLITYVDSPNIGNIAIRLHLPDKPRYTEGAPIVIDIANFFTGGVGFHSKIDATAIGAILVEYLWPGWADRETGAESDGTYDQGGPDCLAALRDVIRFTLGLIPNVNGFYIHDLLEITPLIDNIGLYAFSHPGIAGTNVLAYHGEDISTVNYFVGRENPTIDTMYALEPGHFTDERTPVINPFYHPENYLPHMIDIEYSTVGWIQNAEYPEGRPIFSNPNGSAHILSEKVPRMWGKRYYSIALTQALLDNGTLTRESWPEDLATPEETAANWPFRTTVNNYPLIGEKLPDLKVMLVFATDDHVQSALDKPHIHQAYDGFHNIAGLWIRLNPDLVYIHAFVGKRSGEAFTDNSANIEPNDWMNARDWGYQGKFGSSLSTQMVPLAALAEMMDRTQFDNWKDNLDTVIYDYIP